MLTPKLSACGRIVVLDRLHLDREVFSSISTWAAHRGMRTQDAIQLALCAFGDIARLRDDPGARCRDAPRAHQHAPPVIVRDVREKVG